MQAHDPLKAPNLKSWLELDESERVELIEAYHRRARIRLPNLRPHSALHAVVENQAALGGQTPVRRTLQRPMKEGADRHEAIHAVASLLTDLSSAPPSKGGATARYLAKLERLTVASWRRTFA